MFALLLWLMMWHPVVYGNPSRDYNPDTDPCAGMEAGDWHRCQPREVRLGEWDVRPAPAEWPSNANLSEPKSWGEYATEKR